MARAIVLGNEVVFAAFDKFLRLREFISLQSSGRNHVAGEINYLGFWVRGELLWSHDSRVSVEICNRDVTIECAPSGLNLRVRYGLDGCSAVTVAFTNEGEEPVKVFWNSYFKLGETDIENTVFYYPQGDRIIHYRGYDAVVLVVEGMEDYACGVRDVAGAAGTWHDAEDGVLSGNPIDLGCVDATVGFWVAPEETRRVGLLPTLGLKEAQSIAVRFTGDFEPGTDEETVDAHFFMAAVDSDIMISNRVNYASCWPRDVVETVRVTDKVADALSFIEKCLEGSGPLLLQKYDIQSKPAASWHPWIKDGKPIFPYQLDENAAVIELAFEHGHPLGGRLLLALSEMSTDGIPPMGWDLWEERYGHHLYSFAVLIRALTAAMTAGHDLGSQRQRLLDFCRDTFFVDGLWRRSLLSDGTIDMTPDASILRALPTLDTDSVKDTVRWLEESLRVETHIGGYARYDGDWYFRQRDDLPGNPWIMTTLWMGKALHDLGDTLALKNAIHWCDSVRQPGGMLPEQVHPETGEALGVCPLAWSHAEYIKHKRLLDDTTH